MNYTGNNGTIKVEGVQIFELIGYTIDETTETVETPTMDGSCASDVSAGTQKFAGTIEAHYDHEDIALASMLNGATVAAVFHPMGDDIGLVEMAGTILITGISMPVERDSMVTQSFTFEGKGVLLKTVII